MCEETPQLMLPMHALMVCLLSLAWKFQKMQPKPIVKRFLLG